MTNCHVCFLHLVSHLINSEHKPFGPTYWSQEQGEEGGKGVYKRQGGKRACR